jgi:hypothetical protein
MLFLSILSTANAGYIIRGINTPSLSKYMKNYTLTFNQHGEPVAAGTMIYPDTQEHSIVIVGADTNRAYVFPILIEDKNLIMEVRDFHYLPVSKQYILCGSCGEKFTRGFIAIVDDNFNFMTFWVYEDADMFYSIWAEELPNPYNILDYYVCGIKGGSGIIASIDRSNMQYTNFLSAKKAADWHFHKIITKLNSDSSLYFVASGRNSLCTQIGFTTFSPKFVKVVSYAWDQQTEPASHCVVSATFEFDNKIILASSFKNCLTLNPVYFPITHHLRAYRFNFSDETSIYCVQDIDVYKEEIISVAGFKKSVYTFVPNRAWHGFTIGFVGNPMYNNIYSSNSNVYEHYKTKFRKDEVFTGGFYQDFTSMGALFSTPLKPSICDNYDAQRPVIETLTWYAMYFSYPPYSQPIETSSLLNNYTMPIEITCAPFKGGATPEFAMPSQENGIEIITFYDYIKVKDAPINTSYQIYTVHGQLVQTGTTLSPDISTAQLCKGIYILRLENGKAFKFVK